MIKIQLKLFDLDEFKISRFKNDRSVRFLSIGYVEYYETLKTAKYFYFLLNLSCFSKFQLFKSTQRTKFENLTFFYS